MVLLCILSQFGLGKFCWELIWFAIILFGMDEFEFGSVRLMFVLFGR